MKNKQLELFLLETKCSSLLEGKKIVEISSSISIKEGCQILIDNGISSAPVFSSTLNEYIGMLDFRDIVEFILILFHRSESKDSKIASFMERPTLHGLIEQYCGEEDVMVGDVVDLSRKNPFYSVLSQSSLIQLVQVFSSNVGIHRVNVVDNLSGGKVVGILSKSDLVKFIYSMDIPELQESLEECGLSHSLVISIKGDSMLLDALDLMSINGLSSIAILENGVLFGNISMTDVRFLFKRNSSLLFMDCRHFVRHILEERSFENGGIDSFPIYEMHPESTLKRCIEKLIATRSHRIWIVEQNIFEGNCAVVNDSDDEPKNEGGLCGVVSLTDIIHYLCQ